MALLNTIKQHVKHAAAKTHGFFKGLLEGTTDGSSIGLLTGAAVGLGLAATGIIGGPVLLAVLSSVAVGGLVGGVVGGTIGSLHSLFHRRKAQEDSIPPERLDPQLQQNMATAHETQVTREIAAPEVAMEAAQEKPELLPQTEAVPVKPRAERLKPAHYQTKDQSDDFRSNIVKERLARAIAFNSGASR